MSSVTPSPPGGEGLGEGESSYWGGEKLCFVGPAKKFRESFRSDLGL